MTPPRALVVTALLFLATFHPVLSGSLQSSFVASKVSPRPYTTEWVSALEQIYNTFGKHKNASDECAVELPAFQCTQPEDEDDGIADADRDVWHLRPKDIRVVIGLGDSITAGFAMLSGRPPFSSIWEYRGKVFSSGGDSGEYTLPNFLSIYTNVSGAPLGVTLPLSHGKNLNDAISGAVVQSLPYEATRLASNLRHGHRYASVRGGWKVATLLIGANNLCTACMTDLNVTAGENPADPDVFESELRKTLEILRVDVGRVFVNLVELFHVTLVYEASRGEPYCEFLFDKSHLYICPCAQGDPWQRAYTDKLNNEYNRRLQVIADDYAARGYADFAVVAQPGLTNFKVADYGPFLSGVDCFHPNRCANQVMAIQMWNNMFSESSKKSEPIEPDNLSFKCPKGGNYLQ